MKKKGIIIALEILLVAAIIALVVLLCSKIPNNNKEKKEVITLVSDSDIYITTDDKFTTLQNDGGSYYNREYVVDFNTLVATGYEDHYVGFEGFEYQHKEFYSKQLTQEDFKKLEKIRTDVTLNPQEDVNKTYSYYTIGGYGGSYKIYNRDTIEEIENILH